MPVNRYFNRVDQASEKSLFEDMVIEMIQINGVEVLYIPREILELDPILREPKKSVFNRAWPIEVYFADTGQYGGEQNILSKFGFRINQTTELLMSKRRWNELGTGWPRPRTGDLIYVGNVDAPFASFTNTMFEVNNVWYQDPDWQFGGHFTFKLTCETYTASYEKIETGVKVVDSIQLDNEKEVDEGINDEVIAAKQELLKFDTGNPFGEF